MTSENEIAICPAHNGPETDCYLTCDDCGTEYHTQWLSECPNCMASCGQCRAMTNVASMVDISGVLYCEDCTEQCDDCGSTYNTHSMVYIDSSTYCGDCVTQCEECDAYLAPGSECEDCGDVIGLIGYGRTCPTQWFGGPLPYNRRGTGRDGYYLGFELEITAHRGNARAVTDWANENGMPDGFECKRDSTVEGFEIASQPMTPQFFESIDWDSFFDMLGANWPAVDEPDEHGLHVHIGRVAFSRESRGRGSDLWSHTTDPTALASFCHLIGQGDYLERIGRREPTGYCEKVIKPTSTAIVSLFSSGAVKGKQAVRLDMSRGCYPGRDAINLTNRSTIEIRAFKSTRKSDDLRAAMRMVYMSAEYVRSLRFGEGLVGPKALQWDTFIAWAKKQYPTTYTSLI